MGVYSGGRCYANSSEAVDALFSSSPPSFSGDCILTLSRLEEGWIVSKQCPFEVNTYAAVSPSLPSCEAVDSLLDGFVLAWAVVAVWFAAWGIKVLARAL